MTTLDEIEVTDNKNWFIPAQMTDWYGADGMNIIEKSGGNIPYGGWGRVQPTFGEVYGAEDKLEEKTVPYGLAGGRELPVYSDVYGAEPIDSIISTVQTTNFVWGFLTGIAALVAYGYYMRKKGK